MKDKADMELDLMQIKADILIAGKAIDESLIQSNRLSKYLRGQAAFHLQQAAEKLIKIQMYNSSAELDYAKVYKHSISALINYADDKGIELIVPDYIIKHSKAITGWASEGRYDVHKIVRTDTLEKCLSIISDWFGEVSKTIKKVKK